LGACSGFLHVVLLIRMVANVVKVLPPEKRFPVNEYRYHYPEVVGLHKEFFPRSAVRVAWRLSALAAPLFVLSAITLYYRGAQ
jgi:hypothetical protein